MKNQNEPLTTEQLENGDNTQLLILIGGLLLLIVIVCLIVIGSAGKTVIGLAETISRIDTI